MLARLTPAGMPLKGDPKTAVRRLTWKEPAEWLGWSISLRGKKMVVNLADKAWDNLEDHLALAAREPDSLQRVRQVLPGWISQQGPCYPQLDSGKFYDRIVTLTVKHVQRIPRYRNSDWISSTVPTKKRPMWMNAEIRRLSSVG